MVDPESGHAATTTAVGVGTSSSQRPQQEMGSIGEAAQLVEAALHARMAASQDQRFATTKTLFFALSSLCKALRSELRMKSVGQVGFNAFTAGNLFWGQNYLELVREVRALKGLTPFLFRT